MSHAHEQSVSRITVPDWLAAKGARQLAVVTAYDAPSAEIADAAGVDAILVGDSLANVVQGQRTTLSVTLDEMIYHATLVARVVQRALVVVDLPFPYAQLGNTEAVRAAAAIIQKSNADAVKIEGGVARAGVVEAVVAAGIPVMGHCGLLPQEIKRLGRYHIQRDAEQLLCDSLAVEKAGAFSLVLECVPEEAAVEVTKQLAIPTIGIGAGQGSACDGQVLVFHDLVGYSEPSRRGQLPQHVKQWCDVGAMMSAAIRNYVSEVRSGVFPVE